MGNHLLPVPIPGNPDLHKAIKAGEYIRQLIFLNVLGDVAYVQTDHILIYKM